ncbi:hypothetical protein [Occultella kanbiaonis]|uniref:hypothetical protein n=1 Tax=Occultella kanbiaonis TaxID=2675754 RepID=UPI0013D59715|nr:hypothetical protein [Occultella kanbiaonis]
MPSWARWRTIRATMWQICDTESRYYLPRTGQPSRDRVGDLAEELTASQRHVRTVLLSMPRDAVHRSGGR